MTARRTRWAAALGLLLGLHAAGRGQDVWHAVGATPTPPPPAVVASTPPGPAPAAPAVTLGRPQPLEAPAPAPSAFPDALVSRVAYSGEPVTGPDVVQAQAPDPPPPVGGPVPLPPPPPPPGLPPPPPGVGDAYNPGADISRPLGHSFWDKCKGWLNWGDACSSNCRQPLQSDHEFDYFASPVSLPFYFEDPRALTEVRPIFLYSSAPSGNPIFRGGNSEFFGLQGRLAVTERLSFVINELGVVSLNPNNPVPPFSRDTGFAEFHIGPKYTFLRNTCTRSVAAVGLDFQIPTGSGRVFQDTGNLSLNPYVSYAQNFGRLPAGYGSFDFLMNLGYSVSVDNKRSDYFHSSFQFDYNVANLNKIYPFLVVNWLHYTNGGHTFDPGFGFEGGDLANFGSRNVGARDYVSLGPGLRYKFSECIQTGIAAEWALTSQKEISEFRLTLDLIFRY
jgi:hypothetical protein